MIGSFSPMQVAIVLFIAGGVMLGTAFAVSGSAQEVQRSPNADFVSEDVEIDRTSNGTGSPLEQLPRQQSQAIPVEELSYENLTESQQLTIDKSLNANNSTAVETLSDFPRQFILTKDGQQYQFNSQPAQQASAFASIVGVATMIAGLALILRSTRNRDDIHKGGDVSESSDNSRWKYDVDDERDERD